MNRFDPEDLLAEMGWVQGLALGLVRDPNVASDVAQEAYLQALEGPPGRGLKGRGLRAWLASVTRTLARQAYRSETRRKQREHSVASRRAADTAPSTFEVVSRGALQERIVKAVMSLEEPYRTAVLLRYLDGLSFAEIAEAQGASAAAVRKRLSRALERLRDRLDRELEEEGGLRSLMLLLPGGGATELQLAKPLGGIGVMGQALPTAIAVAVAAIGVSLYFDRPAKDPVSEPPRVSHLDLEPEPAGVSARLRTDSGDPREPARAAIDKGVAASTQVAPVAPARSSTVVRVRILDARGWPLNSATLSLESERALHATADTEGRIELELPFPDARPQGSETHTLLLVASAPGYSEFRWHAEASPKARIDLGEVRLVPVDKVVGRVVDGGGAPVPGAYVHASHPVLNPSNRGRARLHGPQDRFVRRMERADEEGYFEIGNMRAGRWRIWAGHPGMLWSHSRLIELPEENPEPLQLTLDAIPDHRRIAGVVLDPEGRPFPGAMILAAARGPQGERVAPWWRAKSGANGRFSFGVEQDGIVDLRVLEHEGRYHAIDREGVQAGTTELVVRLSRGRRMTLRATGPEGEPIDPFFARMRRVGHAAFRPYFPARGAPRGVVDALVPTGPFYIDTDTDDYVDVSLGPFDPQSVPEELLIELARPARVHGRVHGRIDGGVRAIAGARVQLVRQRSVEQLDYVSGFPSRLNGFGLEGTKADSRGRFEVPIRLADEFVLFVEADGWAAGEFGPMRLDPHTSKAFDVELTRGGSIEGRVLAPEGESPAGMTVRLARGDMRVHKVRTGPDGRFRMDRLTPGPWMVGASRKRDVIVPGAMLDSEVRVVQVSEDYELPWDCEVFEGEVTRFDIDIRKLEVGHVAGRILVGGKPLRGAGVHVAPIDGSWTWESVKEPQGRTRSDGAFELADVELGTAWIIVTPLLAPHAGTRYLIPFEVERGRNVIDVTVETTILQLPPVDSATGLLALITDLGDGAMSVRSLGTVDIDGLVLPHASVGRARLVHAGDAGEHDDPLSWETWTSFDVGKER